MFFAKTAVYTRKNAVWTAVFAYFRVYAPPLPERRGAEHEISFRFIPSFR